MTTDAFDAGAERSDLAAVRILLAASYRFSSTSTLDQASDVLADIACSLTAADRAHVFLPYEPGSAVLTNANAAQTDVGRGVLRIDPEPWVIDLRSRLTSQQVFVADASRSTSIHPGLRDRFGTASGLYLPLGDFGVLALGWREQLAQAPDVPGLDDFVRHAAQVLSRRMEAALLRGLSLTDPLTGIANRRALFLALQALPTDGSLVVFDLDHFKVLNDEHGHREGDLALQRFARSLETACPPDGCAARYGGEEFALVIPTGAAAEARHVTERVRGLWAGTGLTFSAGIAVQRQGATAEETMEAADRALYAAKRAGRNRIVLAPEVAWDEEQVPRRPASPVARTSPPPDDRLTLALLDEALDRGMIEPHYQPVVSTSGQGAVATEVLARLRHPRTGQLLEPLHFLPLAERTGRVARLDAMVCDRALAACARWRRETPHRLITQGVNVSVAHLDDPSVAERLLDGCRRYGLDTDALMVEVTETMQSFRGRGHEKVLRTLADAGVRIALDDFGTGFAALSYLLRFPVSTIKIDRSFVSAAVDNDHGHRVLAATIELGHRLGLTVVAEGVETTEQCELLRELGCELVQGYLFGRPMPEADVPAALALLAESPIT